MEPSFSIPAICRRIIQKQMAELQKQSFVDGMELQPFFLVSFLLKVTESELMVLMIMSSLLHAEVGSVSGNIYHWHPTLLGPPNSPFAGGKFVLNIHFQPENPLKPPMVRFQTNIFHPNISPSCGGISMRILRQHWVPRISMLKVP
ncbi:hypothetical protein BUALT_Bualt05G0074000 [Buddleja alternifolia]|uniref:UBC core domain-containing protein n=1 Tax=Buddleja alternifolia TaxID=168488 RepID=A0AAV6XH97_9LAMI|nr:hypothetical protein BUALT_Bualt05G0074000 [Buddleja alternifolia]